MTQQAQRTDPLQSVEIIGVVMGHLIHYFPRPIGTVGAPAMPGGAYALQVVIPPHTAIDPGALLIVSREPAILMKHSGNLITRDGGLYVERSGKIGNISWHQSPPANAERVIWIRMP